MDDEILTVSSAARAVSPYVGLNYFIEADADWFFGRDEESQTIIANLRASRLTILFSQSGVGKSSLLRAGVAHQIRELAQRSLAGRGSARYVPVVFNEWKDDPVEDLIGAIEKAIEPLLPEGEQAALPRDGLKSAIETAAASVDAKLLIILDQFEEYFLYRTRERGRRFADELADCVNDPALRANFLIAIREDAYAGLGDLFAGKITNVYGNYLQLEYLDRDAARETIVKPIERFNELHPQEQPIEIEPALVEAVLDQVRTGEVVVGQGGQGRVNGGNGARRRREEIETPYLQLVMATLWAHERKQMSRVLRLSTLQELGGAQEIVRTHLDGALAALPADERDTALDLFRYLVTPSGTKIVYAASDLAEMVDRPEDRVADLLAELDHKRIVRHVPPPAGKSQPDDRYEIFHDVLAPAIVDWRRRALEQRKRAEDGRERARLEREKHEADERARRDRRQSRILLALLGLVLAVVVAAFVAWRAAVADRNTAQSGQLAASANADLGRNPELSAQLALAALQKSHTPQAEAALRSALPLLELRRTLKPGVSVTSAAYSPDGSLIVTGESDGIARIWSASGTQLATLGERGLALNSVVFSPNGKLVATAGNDGTARIWNVSTHAQEGKIEEPQQKPLLSVAFSHDGTRLVTASRDDSARIWKASGTQLGVAKPSGGVQVDDAQFSPDDQQIVTADYGGTARVWDAAPQGSSDALTERYALHEPGGDGLLSAAFSPSGSYIVTTSLDGSARIWSAGGAAPAPPSLLPEEFDATNSAAFSPDSKLLVTAGATGSARIFAVQSGKEIAPALTAPGNDTLNTAVFAPDGRHVLTTSADGSALIWDRAHPHQPAVALDASGSDALERASFSADGKLIAAVGADGTASVWEVASGRRTAVIGEEGRAPLTDVAFDPLNSSFIVTGSEDGTADIWDTANGEGLRIAEPLAAVTAVAFTSNGDRLAVAAGDTVEIFDTTAIRRTTEHAFGTVSPNRLATLHAPAKEEIRDVAFDPEGTLVVTAGEGGYARIWSASASTDTEVGRPIEEPAHAALETARFSPDGRFIVTASRDGTARIWNVAQRDEDGAPLTEPGNSFLDAEFNADGSRILTGGADGVARIWDARTQRLLSSRAGHTGRITSASFSPAAPTDLIATSSADGTVRLWRELPREQLGPTMAPRTNEAIKALALGPQGQIVTAGADGVARVWSTSAHKEVGNPIVEPGRKPIDSVAFSPDGHFIATASEDGTARIWNARTHREEARRLMRNPSGYPFNSVEFSPHGDLVVAGGYDGSYIWELGERASRPLGEIPQSEETVWTAAFSRDGRRIVTTTLDGTARIWEGWRPHGNARLVAVLSEPGGATLTTAAFSTDGKLVVTASEDGTARVWNATSGKQEQVLEEPGRGTLASAVFSEGGNEVLTAGTDGKAVIWDRSSGTPLTELPVGDEVEDAVFAPHGSAVVTVDAAGATQVWSTELAGSIASSERIAKEWLTERLTSAELAKLAAG